MLTAVENGGAGRPNLLALVGQSFAIRPYRGAIGTATKLILPRPTINVNGDTYTRRRANRQLSPIPGLARTSFQVRRQVSPIGG